MRNTRATSDKTRQLRGIGALSPRLISAFALIITGLMALTVPILRDALHWNSHFIVLNHTITAQRNNSVVESAGKARLAAVVPNNALAQDIVAEQFSYDDLLAWGDKERAEGDHNAALLWYERAAERNPESADALYYVGISHESLSQPVAARAALKQALERPHFAELGTSDIYARLARAETQLEGPVDWEAVLTATTAALALDQFSEKSFEEIRAHYLQGEALRNLQQPASALDAYGWVVAREPKHYWAHIQYGVLLWEVETDARQAETILRHALTIDPSHPAAYLRLADLLSQTDQIDDAIALYQQLLQINPNHAQAIARLENLQSSERP